MVSAGDFRKGVTVEIEGKVYVIVDFQIGRASCRERVSA